MLDEAGSGDVELAGISPRECAQFLLGLGIVRGLLSRLDRDERAHAEAAIRAELDDRHCDGSVMLASGVWLVTATA